MILLLKSLQQSDLGRIKVKVKIPKYRHSSCMPKRPLQSIEIQTSVNENYRLSADQTVAAYFGMRLITLQLSLPYREVFHLLKQESGHIYLFIETSVQIFELNPISYTPNAGLPGLIQSPASLSEGQRSQNISVIPMQMSHLPQAFRLSIDTYIQASNWDHRVKPQCMH